MEIKIKIYKMMGGGHLLADPGLLVLRRNLEDAVLVNPNRGVAKWSYKCQPGRHLNLTAIRRARPDPIQTLENGGDRKKST